MLPIVVGLTTAVLTAAASHPVYLDARPGQGTVNIAQGGKPLAVVVVAENPTRVAQVAAREFVHYVRQMTGAELPIMVDAVASRLNWFPRRVLIGESSLTRAYGLKNADFAEQEYLIQTRGQDLILMGRDAEEYGLISYEHNGLWPTAGRDGRSVLFIPMGSLYAVHTFLERWGGVRWYLPGEIGEVCPKRDQLAVADLSVRTRPWTRYRMSSRTSFRDPFHFYGSSEEGGPPVTVPPREAVLYMLRLKMGGSPFACNHSFYSYERRFGQTHPQWWKEGKPSAQWPHPNYLDPALIRQAAQDAMDYFAGKYPDGRYPDGSPIVAAGDYFAVMPLDGRKGLIWSPEAEKLRHADPAYGVGFSCGWASDYVFTLVNEVARIVGRQYPDKWITCAAYGPYFLPPARIGKMEPNVAIMQAGWLHSSLDPDNWRLHTENLKAWRQRVNQLYVWEYYLDQSFAQFRSFPVVFPRQVARAMRFLNEVGVQGMFFEASAAPARGGRYTDGLLANPAEDLLNHYVTWKYLVDASADIEAVLDEHYRLFYGPAAKPMKAFFDAIEAAWQAHRADLDKRPRDEVCWERMCPPEKLSGYRDLIGQAQALATAEPYASRVRLMREAIYRRMEKNGLDHAWRWRPRPRVACPAVATRPTVDGRLDDTAWCQAGRTGPLQAARLEPPEAAATALLARDAQMLYVAVDCPEPAMGQVQATADVMQDDHVQVFLDVHRSRSAFVRLAINAAGAVSGRRVDAQAGKESPWDPKAVVRTARTADRWTVEAAIPLESLGSAVQAGDVWGLNLCRQRRAGLADPAGEKTWWALPTGLALSPDEFGVMVMTTAEAALQEDGPVIDLTFDGPIGPGTGPAGMRLLGKGWTDACRVPGRVGSAYAFRKSEGRYIQVDFPPALGLERDDFTLMLWLCTSVSGGQTLVASTTSSPYWGLSLGEADGRRVLQFLMGAPAPGVACRVEAPAADGQWHHVAVALARGGEARLYVDGRLAGRVDIRAHRLALKPWVTVGGPYHPFEGTLDALQIYKGALEPSRVQAIYDAQARAGR